MRFMWKRLERGQAREPKGVVLDLSTELAGSQAGMATLLQLYTSTMQNDEPYLVLLPLLIVLSTFLLLLLLFLLCILLLRRRRSIILRDADGPTDMSREEFIDGDGGFEGIETRWMESVPENSRREYLRAKGEPLTFSAVAGLKHMVARIPSAIPTQFSANRYYAFPVLIYPRERRFCMVV